MNSFFAQQQINELNDQIHRDSERLFNEMNERQRIINEQRLRNEQLRRDLEMNTSDILKGGLFAGVVIGCSLLAAFLVSVVCDD